MATRDFPVGKAQQQVLDALGLQAEGFQAADRLFTAHGIVVSSKRVGRVSIPVVRRLAAEWGGWEGDSGVSGAYIYQPLDLTPVAHWMEGA